MHYERFHGYMVDGVREIWVLERSEAPEGDVIPTALAEQMIAFARDAKPAPVEIHAPEEAKF